MVQPPPVLYEQIVHHDCVADVGTLIHLSELARGEDALLYADKLEELIVTLKKPNARLQAQPLFQWEQGMTSPCFRFELHRTLMQHHDALVVRANKAFAENKHDEASQMFSDTARTALRMLSNLKRWTSVTPELRRLPPFHPEFLLSLAARARCREHHAQFCKVYDSETKGIQHWKHGAVTAQQRQVFRQIETSCRFCTLANLLWARPGGVFGVTTSASDFEKDLTQTYHRVASYCADSFQARLNHANACADVYEDCKQVLTLNDRLYYLTPKPIEAPAAADMTSLLE